MSETLFVTHDWPRAIIHVDGDAFFTSCEEAIHPELRGKPIITGGRARDRRLRELCGQGKALQPPPRRIAVFLKKQNFDTTGCEAKLNRPSAHPMELSNLLRSLFNCLYRHHGLYRATGVVLLDLVSDTQIQYSLFEDPLKAEKIRELYEAVDALSGKYGKHTLHLGGSHPIEVRGRGRRGGPTVREQTLLYGETRRKHLGIPLLQADFPPANAPTDAAAYARPQR